MRIGREGSAECESIRAGLLLSDPPLRATILLLRQIPGDEFRPFDSGLDPQPTALAIESQNAAHPARIDDHAIGEELLATHGMARAGGDDGFVLPSRIGNGFRQFRVIGRNHQASNLGGIQAGMDIVGQEGVHSGTTS